MANTHNTTVKNISLERLESEVETNVKHYNDMLVYDEITEQERNNWLGTLNVILQDSYLQYTRKGGHKVLTSQQDNSYKFAHETIVETLKKNQQGIGTQISVDALYKLMLKLQRSSVRAEQDFGDLIKTVAQQTPNNLFLVKHVIYALKAEAYRGPKDYRSTALKILSIVTGE